MRGTGIPSGIADEAFVSGGLRRLISEEPGSGKRELAVDSEGEPEETPEEEQTEDVAEVSPTDDGGVAQIQVVRLCSREHVCRSCGPPDVIPQCQCMVVLYDPLTDPDYFLH
jgi:hypothetical protein